MIRSTPLTAISVLSLCTIAFAQNPPDVAALISSSIANAEQNAKAALAYTFHENYVISLTMGTDSSSTPPIGSMGRPSVETNSPTAVRQSAGTIGGGGEVSTQYDVLFIEGVPYRRVLSNNHQPLSADAAATESKRYDRAVATIHAMSHEQRLAMVKGGKSLAVDPRQLADNYDCKITGHEKVHKRPATVVQCKLHSNLPAQTDTAANPLATDIKLWIDDQQPFFVKTRAVMNHPIDRFRTITDITTQWSLIDGVWHQTSTEADWVGRNDPKAEQGKIVDTFSDFKRFRSEATILPGYDPDVPLPPQP